MAPEKRKGSPLPSNASVGDTVIPRKTTRKTFSVVTEGLSDNLNTLRERQRRADMTGERATEDKNQGTEEQVQGRSGVQGGFKCRAGKDAVQH
jgi:hypothetical protein